MKKKNAYILVGARKLNKRIALFHDSLVENGFHVSIISLPRSGWDFSPSEKNYTEGYVRKSMTASPAECACFPPDYVFCFHWSLCPAAVALKLLFNATIIYDEHDMYHLNALEGGKVKGRLSGKLIKIFNFLFLRRFDLITCIHMKDGILSGYLSKYNRNVLELNNYPTREWMRPRPWGESEGPLKFVFPGGIYDVKGCRIAAEAFLEVVKDDGAEVEMHFFGSGDAKLMDWLGSQRSVFVHGSSSAGAIRQFLHENRCVGLLLYQDTPRYRFIGTNSHKMFEYICSGTPLIASSLGEIENFISENGVGYIIDRDFSVKSVAAALRRALIDIPELSRMSENCLRAAGEKSLWWEKEMEKVTASRIFDQDSKSKKVAGVK